MVHPAPRVCKTITLAGSGAGGLVYSLVIEKILKMLDLAWTFRVTACSTFLFNAASTALIRSRNKTVKPVHSLFKGSLVRNWNFLWIQAWMALSVSSGIYNNTVLYSRQCSKNWKNSSRGIHRRRLGQRRHGSWLADCGILQ